MLPKNILILLLVSLLFTELTAQDKCTNLYQSLHSDSVVVYLDSIRTELFKRDENKCYVLENSTFLAIALTHKLHFEMESPTEDYYSIIYHGNKDGAEQTLAYSFTGESNYGFIEVEDYKRARYKKIKVSQQQHKDSLIKAIEQLPNLLVATSEKATSDQSSTSFLAVARNGEIMFLFVDYYNSLLQVDCYKRRTGERLIKLLKHYTERVNALEAN